MEQGWICIHRQIKDNWVWEEKPFSRGQAWIDLLLRANHADKKVVLGNEIIMVCRGSFVTSEIKLAEAWGWSKTKVRTFLMLLENDSMIVKKSDRKKTTINIVNYSSFQDLQTTEKPQKNYKKTTEKPQKNTNNNENNENNENKESIEESSPVQSRISYAAFQDYFNTKCTAFPQVKEMTDKRKAAIKSFLSKHTESELYQVFDMAQDSDFLSGRNDRQWRASFDWIIKSANAVKILEGNYQNKNGGKQYANSSTKTGGVTQNKQHKESRFGIVL